MGHMAFCVLKMKVHQLIVILILVFFRNTIQSTNIAMVFLGSFGSMIYLDDHGDVSARKVFVYRRLDHRCNDICISSSIPIIC